MEILDKGKPKREQDFIVDCGTCNSRIKFTWGEAETIFTPRNENLLKIECPVCHNSVYKDIS